MTPVRVFFPFVGDTIGGSHRSAMLLMRSLDRARYLPIVAVHRDGLLRTVLGNAGIDARFIPHFPVFDSTRQNRLRAFVTLICSLPRLVRFLRAEEIDIVHCHDARMTVTWALPARLAGCSLVVHQRTRYVRSRIPMLATTMAHRVVCISRFVANTLPSKLKSRAIVIINPFDVAAPIPDREEARHQLLRELGTSKNARIVTFVGTFQEQKRPDVFVEAAARMLFSTSSPLVFVMAGRMNEIWITRIKGQALERGLEGRFHLLGYRTDIQNILAASDVVLAPAIEEGFGRVLVESALCGTPVVATRSGGHPEAITHGCTGLLVSRDNPVAMADAALNLLDDQVWRVSLVTAARRRAESEFSPVRHATRVMAVYDSIRACKVPERSDDIAFVIEGLGGGGAQHVLTTLANAWATKGWQVAIITFSAEVSEGFSLDSRVRHVMIGSSGKSSNRIVGGLSNLWRILKLRRALKRSGAPIVVPFIAATNVLTIIATAGLGLRVIVCERNDPERQHLGLYWNLLRRWTYPLASLVTANTHAALEALSSFVPCRRLRLVPNPLRTPQSDTTMAIDASVILSVGRLHSQKAYDILLAAFAKSRLFLNGWCLIILGEGNERTTLEKKAIQLGVSDFVDLPGQVADPFPWYKAANIFVLASRYEGSPNALLEAMSCGVVPIVTDAQPGALELIEDGVSGLVVGVDDVTSLAAALCKLANNKALRRQMGSEARSRVAGFAPSVAIKEWECTVFGQTKT